MPAAGSKVFVKMTRHASAIISDQYALGDFQIAQDVGIECSKRRRAVVTDPEDINTGIVTFDGGDNPWRQIFVKQKAWFYDRRSRCAFSACTRRLAGERGCANQAWYAASARAFTRAIYASTSR